MFLRQDPSAAHLRKFVGRMRAPRREAREWLIAEAVRRLLLPPLQDILPDLQEEPLGLRLTYATACVIVAELLVQRFPAQAWAETASSAVRRIGLKAGLDESDLTKGASSMILELTAAEPLAYRDVCRQFDAAIEHAVFLQKAPQGEVLLRLALERLEGLVHKQLASRSAAMSPSDVIRTHGLLRMVRRRAARA